MIRQLSRYKGAPPIIGSEGNLTMSQCRAICFMTTKTRQEKARRGKDPAAAPLKVVDWLDTCLHGL